MKDRWDHRDTCQIYAAYRFARLSVYMMVSEKEGPMRLTLERTTVIIIGLLLRIGFTGTTLHSRRGSSRG